METSDGREAVFVSSRQGITRFVPDDWQPWEGSGDCRVFGGQAFEWATEAAERDAEALAAVRRFVDEFVVMPTRDSWTAAGMSPCERTVRKRFGSFRAGWSGWTSTA